MLLVSNVHEREFAATLDELGALLDTLAGPDDQVWPTNWPGLRLDRGLVEGSSGGHGPIRYRLTRYDQGRHVEFRFDPAIGAEGTHSFEVLPGSRPGRAVLRHTLLLRPTSLTMRVGWPVAVRWLHDALLEDLLDRVERSLGLTPAQPSAPSLYVRALRLGL